MHCALVRQWSSPRSKQNCSCVGSRIARLYPGPFFDEAIFKSPKPLGPGPAPGSGVASGGMSLPRTNSAQWAVEPLTRRIHFKENDPGPSFLPLFCPNHRRREGQGRPRLEGMKKPTSHQTNTDRGPWFPRWFLSLPYAVGSMRGW